MIFFIILLFFIFIILVPIPIKITAHYSSKDYYIKLYGVTLYSKTNGIVRNILTRKWSSSNKKNMDKKININNLKSKNKENNKNLFSIKRIYNILQSNKYKPSIKFSLLGNFSFSNAALTAILYGFFSNLNFILLETFSKFFNVKKFNYSLNPTFNNKLNINLTINCIIIFNFAQIIYMLFFIRKKEVSL